MDERTTAKKDRLLEALELGMTMIHLDARRAGVQVPEHLKGEVHLLLNLSYRFDPPDLSVGEWGVRSTLTFSGKRFTVAVPWPALYAISSHVTKDFWMFPEDMPPELLEKAQLTTKVPLEAVAPKAAAKPARTLLQSIDCGRADEPPDDEPPKPAARNHLRLVK